MYNVILFTGSSWLDGDHVRDPDADIYPVLRSVGAYQVASVLRNNNYSTKVIDYFPFLFHRKYDQLLKIIDTIVDNSTLWIGFSSTFFEGYSMIESNPLRSDKITHFINYIKSKNNKIKIVLGGAHAWRKDFSEIINFYVEGYSDSSVLELTKYLDGKNPFFIFKNKTISSDKTASNFDFTNYMFEWTDEDAIKTNEVLPVEVSRGCIFKCSYCSYPLNGKKKLDFIKNPNILYDHFVENYEKFGVTSYMYTDDTHNDSIDKLEFLYNNVYSKLPFKIKFNAYIRLDLLRAHPITIDLLKDSGISSCFFGIESLNYESNKSVGKGMRPDRIIETLLTVREKWNDVFLQGGFIVGLPNETEKTANQWLDMITNLDFPLDHITLNPLHLFKNQGSDGYWANDIEKFPEKYGYSFLTNDNWISNTGMTKDVAIDLNKKYRFKMLKNKRNKVSWLTKWRLQNLDLNINHYAKMDVDEIRNHVDKFFDQYIERCIK